MVCICCVVDNNLSLTAYSLASDCLKDLPFEANDSFVNTVLFAADE